MAGLPQTSSDCRARRLRLKDDTAAVLRFTNGQRIVATLRVISTTGGLLSVPQLLIRGSRVTVRFLAGCDSVLGNAEILSPINEELQPFRFISLAADAYLRLGALISEQSSQFKYERTWIDKLRAASVQRDEGRYRSFKLAETFGPLTLGLATAVYLLQPGFLN